jgi:hypothetical protein
VLLANGLGAIAPIGLLDTSPIVEDCENAHQVSDNPTPHNLINPQGLDYRQVVVLQCLTWSHGKRSIITQKNELMTYGEEYSISLMCVWK